MKNQDNKTKTTTVTLGGVPVEQLYSNTKKRKKQPKQTKKPSNLVSRKLNEFKPHSGYKSISGLSASLTDFAGVIKLLCKTSAVPSSTDIVREIEGMGALFIAIQGCESMISMLAVITLYLQRYHDKSNVEVILDHIKTIFEFEAQGGEESALNKEEPEWLTYIKRVENWKDIVAHKFFPRFSQMLSILVLTKMFDISELTFSINELIVVQPDLKMIHGSAFDIIDASISTIIYFIENIYYSVVNKSIKPFFMDDDTAVELDQEFALITTWWKLVAVGNLKKHTGKDPREFSMRLEKLTKRLKILMNDKRGIERKLIGDKFAKLLDIRMCFERLKDANGLRRAPFALQFFGPSDVGKTTCAAQMVDALLLSGGFDTGKQYQYKRNPTDEYWSGAHSDILVLGFDDLTNTKPQFVKSSPLFEWLGANNNEIFQPAMADLESKGKVQIEPVITYCTTNKKDLDSYTYSVCPFSIQRRSHVVITVNVKKEFQKIVNGKCQGLDSGKVFDHYQSQGINPPFDDIWTVTAEVAVCPDNLSEIASYSVIEFRGKPLKDVGIRTLTQYLIERFHTHLDIQEKIISTGNKRLVEGVVKICAFEGCKQISGFCDLHDDICGGCFGTPEEDEDEILKEPHVGDEQEYGDKLYEGLASAASLIKTRLNNDIHGTAMSMENSVTFALLASAKVFSRYFDWMTVIPSEWIANPAFLKVLMVMNVDRLKRKYVTWSIVNYAVGLLNCYLICYYFESFGYPIALIAFILIYTNLRQATMATAVQYAYRNELVDRNIISADLRQFRDTHGPTIYKVCGLVGAIYTASKLYHRFRRLQPQGSLEPTTIEQIKVRDSEDNPWCEVVSRPLPITGKSRCTTPDNLMKKIQNNLTYVSVRTSDKVLMANCLFITTGVVVIPSHYFVEDVLQVTFRKEKPEASSGSFTTYISKSRSIRIPGTDLCLVYVDKGGSFGDLSGFLPLENLPDHQFNMFWRKKNGEMLNMNGRAKTGLTKTTCCEFLGGNYISLDTNTFSGMCGATLIGQGRGTCISGFHLGGEAGTPRGCFGVLTNAEYESALERLRDMPGVLLSGSGDKFEEQILGYKIITGNKLHPKSPLFWMPQESQIAYHGSCDGATTGHSDVKVTLISPIVTEVTGEPNIWGPPRIKGYFGWQKCLENMSNTADSFNPDLLNVAIEDYKSVMIDTFRSPHIGKIEPLPDSENMSGIPGKKFIDAIKMGTAIGFPLTGAKRKYVTEVENDDGSFTRVFDPLILDEIERCYQCYRKGERAYTIAKGCKKDEVLAKEKCRIFYSNPISLTFLVRRYFLPLIRVMQLHPLRSECAVGINSHGPEWEELYKHITKYGKDRLLGGDYGKYDQKLSSQLLLASLRILIDFAKECEYTQEDIRVMEAMSGDLVYALIAYNGDLIGLTTGGHISGNSLTVILNGICGSLNLRCVFYSMYDHNIPFREAVALSTYGDDNFGSVKEGFEKFNIKSASEFLAEFGQTYTMPDKESELVPYLLEENFEFLKRRSVYCPEKDCIIGALDDKSIFKMLHCYLRPKGVVNSERLACAINLGAALREWSNHGREKYEFRHKQCVEIAEKADLLGLCPELNLTYDDLVTDWKKKYTKNYELYSTTLEVEE